MNDFFIKWLLSLIVGGVWVTVSTWVAEKVSGRLGGLIVGLPSTAAVSILFIGITQGVEATEKASVVMPLSSGLYCAFFITYLLLSRKGFWSGLLKSLVVWFVFAFISSKLPVSSLFVSSIIWITLVSSSIWWVQKNIKINKNKIPEKIESGPLWIKASLSGIIISTIVLIGKIAGPTWGGVLATFPALTISTFLITVKSGGTEFTRLIAKNVHISTTTTIGIFAILMYYLAPMLGVIWGVFASYLLLLIISIPLYNLIFDKLKD